MTFYHVKSTGTKNSGESTPDDWSDANCYPTVSSTVNSWAGAVEILLDDNDTIVETTHVKSADFSGVTGLTISARSIQATWSAQDGEIELFNAGPGVADTAIEINKLTLTREADASTLNDRGLFYVESTGCTSFTFNDCIFGNFAVDAWNPVSKMGLIYTSLSTASRTTSFNRCTFQNITTTNPWHSSLVRCGGNDQTFNFNSCNWNDNNIQLNEDQTVGWAHYGENNATININNASINRCDAGAASTATMVRPWHYSGVNTVTVNVDGATFTDCDIGTISATVEGNGWGILVKGPHSITNVHSTNCHFYNSVGFDGGQLYIDGVTAVQSEPTTNLSATGCSSRSGAALFVSNGAAGSYDDVKADDCDTDAGVIYSGGYGDFTLSKGLVIDCRSTAGNDGQIFARNNTEVQNKVATISNCTVVDCTTGGSCAGIKIENNTSGFSMTATINDCISRNANTNDIEAEADATVTINNCNYANAVVVDTENDSTTVDPLFVDVATKDYRLQGNSPLIAAGINGGVVGALAVLEGDAYLSGRTADVNSPGFMSLDERIGDGGRADFLNYRVGG